MNNDRGMIKWIPFSSLVGQKNMMADLIVEKQKIKKPILSLEQQQEIEEKLVEAFYEQMPATFQIYKNSRVISITSTILELDCTYKKIILTNHLVLLFGQILNIVL